MLHGFCMVCSMVFAEIGWNWTVTNGLKMVLKIEKLNWQNWVDLKCEIVIDLTKAMNLGNKVMEFGISSGSW